MLAVRSSPSVDWPFEVTIGSGPKEGQRGTELRRSRRMTGSRYKMATCAPGANFSALTGPTDIFRPYRRGRLSLTLVDPGSESPPVSRRNEDGRGVAIATAPGGFLAIRIYAGDAEGAPPLPSQTLFRIPLLKFHSA
jgi:hypothetical protein